MVGSSGRRPARRLALVPGAERSPEGPVVIGRGEGEFVCGRCFAVVLQGVDLERLRDTVVRCADCGALNKAEVGP
jgi:hypothetical protein